MRTDAEWRDTLVVRRIADGFAHEMNNVLSIIIGRASVLEDEADPDSHNREDIEAILAAGRAGLELTRSLLSFSRDDNYPTTAVSLNDVVGKEVAQWETSGDVRVELKSDLAEDLHDTVGNPARLRRMLIHLGANAIQAMPDGGTLTFTTRNVEIRPEAARADLPAGRYVRLQVADTGEGMDDETLRQAFSPFFTTKPTPSSTGVGLSFVYDTVVSHGGQVKLFSKKGLGTTVTVHLPAAEIDSVRPAPPTPPDHEEGKRVVLLVDDDPLVLRTGMRLVTKLGYEVVTACDGSEALECYDERRDDISVAMIDLIMPRLDGTELLRRLKQSDPNLPVVICSAYPDAAEHELISLGANGFVTKPYTLAELSDVLTRVLLHVRPRTSAP